MIIRVKSSEDPELMECVEALNQAAGGHDVVNVLSAAVGLSCLAAKEDMGMSLDQLLEMVRISWTGVPDA